MTCSNAEPGCACDIADVPCRAWVREHEAELRCADGRRGHTWMAMAARSGERDRWICILCGVRRSRHNSLWPYGMTSLPAEQVSPPQTRIVGVAAIDRPAGVYR